MRYVVVAEGGRLACAPSLSARATKPGVAVAARPETCSAERATHKSGRWLAEHERQSWAFG